MATRPESVMLVLVTAGSEENARAIARTLVEEKLAACVNIVGPIESIYRWKDAVEDESEYLMLIKTRARTFARVSRRVKELHTYEVPEVIGLPIAAGSEPCVQWLLDCTRPASKKR